MLAAYFLNSHKELEKTEEVLRQRAEELETLMETAPVAIWVSHDGRCQEITGNRWANEFYEAEKGENVSANVTDIRKFYSNGRQLAAEELPMQTAVRTGREVRETEFEVVLPSGRRVSLFGTATPLRDADGKVRGCLGAYSDISKLKQAEKELSETAERFRTLADNISQLAWMADENGEIFWFNKRWYEYTGESEESMLGYGWQKVHHPEHAARVTEKFSYCCHTGSIWEDTFPLKAKDGSYRWFLSRAVPIRSENGKVLRWFGTNTDVTELKVAEAALKEADRKKDEFLAVLAHELRNPMAAIGAAASLLSRENLTSERIDLAAKALKQRVGQLSRLVDDLLDVSRIARGKVKLQKEKTDLSVVAGAAAEATRNFFNEKGQKLRVSISEPVIISGDPVRLEQIISNLLSNASRYTPEGGEAVLTVERQEKAAVVKVRDTGVGIPRESLERIFGLFGQADDSLHRSRGGLGVGLTIVKRLTEMHGGSVRAFSEGPGKGSEFELRFPLPIPEALRPPEDDESLVMPGLRFLLVEDHTDTAAMSSALLELSGHKVTVKTDGLAGVEAALKERPDVVLLDIGLPGLDGYQAAAEMRARGLKDALIIAITGYGQERDLERSQNSGIDWHLLKPLRMEELNKILAEYQRSKFAGRQ